MKLKVIKTGSAGNGYALLSSTGECLLIECGVKLSEVKKYLNFDLSKVVGCIVTHEHGDHAKYLKDYANAGINIYAQQATFKTRHHRFKPFQTNEGMFLMQEIGNFFILPFSVKHDVPTVGLLIHHKECGKILFLTDTYYCPYKFENLNQIIIEANYSKEIINKKYRDDKEFLANRIKSSHMSLETCIDLLKANNLSKVDNIVLIHLSDTNSDEKMFKDKVQKATGKLCYVARNGLEIFL